MEKGFLRYGPVAVCGVVVWFSCFYNSWFHFPSLFVCGRIVGCSVPLLLKLLSFFDNYSNWGLFHPLPSYPGDRRAVCVALRRNVSTFRTRFHLKNVISAGSSAIWLSAPPEVKTKFWNFNFYNSREQVTFKTLYTGNVFLFWTLNFNK